MGGSKTVVAVAQAALTAGATLLSAWVAIPWYGSLALGLVGLSSIALTLVPSSITARWERGFAAAGWLGAVAFFIGLFARGDLVPDMYYGALGWLMAVAVSAGTLRHRGTRTTAKPFASALGMTWAFAGTLLYAAGAYWHNQAMQFFMGLLLLLALLILSKVWFRMGTGAIQTVNTLILIIIGLPIADWILRPKTEMDLKPETGRKLYSYESAKQDPAAFRRWWHYYLDQWDLLGKDVFATDSDGFLPFRLRPGGRGRLFESRIDINSLGYRGKEFAMPKGDTYRIVVVGESTTFGCTLRAEDWPWPEVLEDIIRERLHPAVPVEVINAGVPACTLRHSLARFARDIAPLKPDMLITYHGVNGFRMLDSALPSLSGKVPPIYRERPIKLLADAEFRLKVMYHRNLQTARLRIHEPTFSDLMGTAYAAAYRELIEMARTNGVQLVLGSFSMAVNGGSEPGVIEFYGSEFPAVPWFIKANAAHTQIVRELSRQNAGVVFADTQPELDGVHSKFIDVAHLTQEGRRQVAENIFVAIKPVLEERGREQEQGSR